MFRHRLSLVLLVACCLASSGCSSLGLSLFPTGHFLTDRAEAVVAASPASAPLPRERNKTVVPTHFLQPGDVLLIEPVLSGDEIRIPADQTVMVDGSVDLGFFGRVILAGLSIESAEILVEQTVYERLPDDSELERSDVDINVRLIEPVHRYYVLGEVNSPGAYSLRGFETVLDGILEAGGLTTQASNCEIILSRPTDPCSCRTALPICYREIVQLGDTTTNYQLRPGDRIYVSTRGCCDELCFWKANESCEKCDRCQQACGCPTGIGHENPMAGVVAMPIVDNGAALLPFDQSMVESAIEPTVVAGPAAVDAGPAGLRDAATPTSQDSKSFPELMQPPSEFNLPTPRGERPAASPELDGELDLDITPRQSRRFQPMWLK